MILMQTKEKEVPGDMGMLTSAYLHPIRSVRSISITSAKAVSPETSILKYLNR